MNARPGTTTGSTDWPTPRLILLAAAAILAAWTALEHVVEPFFTVVKADGKLPAFPLANDLAMHLLMATPMLFYACGLWQLAEAVGERGGDTRLGELRSGFSNIAYGALSKLLIVPTIIAWIGHRGGFRIDFDPATFALCAAAYVMTLVAGAAAVPDQTSLEVRAARRSLVLTAALGLLACAWFWVALVWFGKLYPEYSQFTKAVSELGALGAPDARAWNIFGFGLTGVLLGVYGWRLARLTLPGKPNAAVWLALSGAAFTGTGVFAADMNDWGAPTTILHLVMSFLVVIAWFIGAWNFLGKHEGIARPFATVTLVVMVLTGLAFAARFVPFVLPGLAQRISFAAYFVWYFASALLVLRIDPAARHRAALA